jgi:hypothetical protein
MRILIMGLAVAALPPIHPGWAQGPVVLAPKTRIRFALPSDERAVVAEVLVQRGESLWVRPLQATDTVTFSLSRLAHLDVSSGQKPNGRRGLGIGFLSGAVVGGVWGYAWGQDCSTADSTNSCWFPRGETALAGAAAIGAVGALVGTLIGESILSDRWAPVPLTDRVNVAMWRGGRGRAYGMRFSYSIF